MREPKPILGAVPWRVGRSVGRTVYDAGGELIGVMDTPHLAQLAVERVNFLGQMIAEAPVPGEPDDVRELCRRARGLDRHEAADRG